MALDIEGKIVKILPETSGQGQSGTWVKQMFVIETREQYPKKLCFTAWGDKVDTIKRLLEGEDIKVSFNAESREFNEKWYTDLKAWKIEKLGAVAKPPVSNKSNVTTPIVENTDVPDFPAEEQGDDLPF
jgi:hypothetical protein